MAVTMIEQQPGCGPPAPVPILQWEKEFAVLLELYRRLEPLKVLEIGTYHGGTLYHWLQNGSADLIVSLDSYAVGVDNRHLYGDWTPKGVRLIVLEGDSHDPITVDEVSSYGPYDFVLIDAGHFYKEVKQDWELYRPLVRESGGIVCFHDILTHPAWPSIEVGQLWEEIRKDYLTFEIVADRDAEWGGIGCCLL